MNVGKITLGIICALCGVGLLALSWYFLVFIAPEYYTGVIGQHLASNNTPAPVLNFVGIFIIAVGLTLIYFGYSSKGEPDKDCNYCGQPHRSCPHITTNGYCDQFLPDHVLKCKGDCSTDARRSEMK